MSLSTPPASDPSTALARRVRRKVACRILPLLFLLYVVAYLDRANVGFAKLQMKDELQFSEEVFGWGIGLFFVGYLFLEIPGALLVEHWSARKWFARILVTWGFCSMAMAFVHTPLQFYVARFFLGLAEAGFYPGVIVYFTHWFPRKDRARAMSAMLIGIPISLALGSRVSSLLLEHGWLGLSGWQWVFLVEGAPALFLGVVVLMMLVDRPHQAKWLSPEERGWLEDALDAERKEAAANIGTISLGQALKMREVWLLALGIFATNIGGYAFVFWLPTEVQGLLRATGADAEPSAVLNWTGLVYLCGLAGVAMSGFLSDFLGHHKWHCIVGQIGSGIFLALSGVPGQPWGMVFAWLCLAGFFAHYWFTPFWVLPTLSLTSSVAAVSIGFINMSANLAGLVGSPVVGSMKTAGFGDRDCLLFLAVSYALGGVIIAIINIQNQIPDREEQW
jgi:ACS family tartrate transporter-like MFS transporter